MDSDTPLYQRDPQAWREHLAEGNRTQPRKRVGADVLFVDDSGGVLIVDPCYKPEWDLPGGMAEANEAPLAAAIREVAEELSLSWTGGRLLVVDWVAPHDPWDDSLMFVFDGGILTAEQQQFIALRDGELNGYRFAPLAQARTVVGVRLARRLYAAATARETGATAYLQDGLAAGPA